MESWEMGEISRFRMPSNDITETALMSLTWALKAFLTIRYVRGEKADAWNDSALGIVCSKKKKKGTMEKHRGGGIDLG